jgi:tetratricopeptide (TPR) repeat protein
MKFWQRKQPRNNDKPTEADHRQAYKWIEQAVHLAVHDHDAENSRRLIQRAIDVFQTFGDTVGEVQALHFKGRIEHELGNEEQAMTFYDQALAMAQAMHYEPVIVRVAHERSRIYRNRGLFILAEDGFRYALNYYASQTDEANLQATLDQLNDLAENALHSPEFFIDALERDGVAAGTPEDYLYVRALAILAEIKDEGLFYRQRLLQKAMALYKSNPRFAFYILRKVRAIAEFRKDGLIINLVDLLHDLWTKPSAKTRPHTETPPRSHKRSTRFNSPDTAARNIEELYNYLAEEDSGSSYVYRGQTREYPGPLLPSMYRSHLGLNDQRVTCDDPIYQYSLRKCGKVFYGEYNTKFLSSLQHVYDGVPSNELKTADAVYKSALKHPFAVRSQFERLSKSHHPITWDAALRTVLSPAEIAVYERYQDQWKPYLDNYHRRMIRMFGFSKPFGYLLGTTLAQQYGLSSAGLDATRSPAIAAFFAAHCSDYKKLEADGTGIIYRFPYTPNDIRDRSLNDYTYYTLPSIIDLKDVLDRFEHPGLPHENMRDIFETYYGAVHIERLKDHDLFMVPEGALASSRVNQQQAVIILPDELRRDRSDIKPGVDGITLPEFQFIEDIASRDGVEKFYFHHTGTFPSSLAITREQLWPRNDPFLEIIVSIMTAFYPIMAFGGHVVPQRLDLIDGGYDATGFVELCKSLAQREPMILVDFEELNAMDNFAIVL